MELAAATLRRRRGAALAALAAVLLAVATVYERATVKGVERAAVHSFAARFRGGRAEAAFDLAPADYLLQVELPRSAASPKEAVLNGAALKAPRPVESVRARTRAAFFTVPAASLRAAGNVLRLRGAPGGDADAVVTLTDFVRRDDNRFFVVLADFGAASGARTNALRALLRGAWALLAAALVSATVLLVPRRWTYVVAAYAWAFALALDSAWPFACPRLNIGEGSFWLLVFGSGLAAAAAVFRRMGSSDWERVDRLARLEPLVERAGAWAARLQEAAAPRAVLSFVAAALAVYYLAVVFFWKRVPLGHDTLQYMQFEYGLLNELVSKGELPLWQPFMTQGTVSNWYVVIPGHMVADLYFLAAPMLKRLNDYPLFLFANYCDEVLFGIGTILLACELYETSWAVFFAATTAVFSTIWLHEIWWNFRLYCWLPFAFCFFLRFIKTGAWRWFLLFCLLAPLSFFAALPYFISPLSFFIFFFCLLTAAASRPELEAGLVASCRKSGLAVPVLKGLGSAALAGALLGLLWLCLRGLGAEDIVLSFFGRDAAGSVARNVFFTYGGNTGWIKFAELLTAVPNSLDQTYYCGLATVVFALLHLRYWEEGEPIRRQSHVFLALIALTASFSCGGLAAELAYRFWPTMKLFRHIGLTGGVTKLLLIFYAAYGVDVFAKRAAAGGAAFLGDLRALLAAFLSVLLLKALLMWLTHSYSTDLAGRLSQAMSSWGLAAAAALWIPAVFAGAIWCGRGGRRAAGLAALFVVTVLQLADVVSYRAVQDSVLAPAGGGGVVDTFRFFDYPYSPARSQKYFTNARFAALDAAARRATDDPDGAADPIVASPDGDAAYDSLRAWPFGAVYWSWESFFYFDACRSIFRVDSRLASVEDFDSVYDEKRKTTYFETRLPRRPAFLKILGCGYPKLQVFKRLHVVPDAAALRSALGSPRYKGDVLFSAGAPPSRAATSVAAPDAALLGADERVDAKIDVRSFAANGIKLAVDNPLSSPAILFYSDAWHKNWRARVDGAPAPIAAANFGFKAVEIPAGRSEVEFSYRPALVKAILRLFVGFNAVMALVLFGLVLAPPFARGSARRPGPAGRNC